jgi:uncharacterized protein (TIGR03086 family)
MTAERTTTEPTTDATTGPTAELDRALDSTSAILRRVRPEQLAAPTPCASWNVSALINHLIGTARWWAAVISETKETPEQDYAAGDYVAAYEESVRIVHAAFAAEGAVDKVVRLELGEFPGAVLLGLAATEQFTHGWDLASAIGVSTELDPVLAEELLAQSRLAVSDAYRGPDGVALFGPEQQAPAGAGAADRLAAFLGRRL